MTPAFDPDEPQRLSAIGQEYGPIPTPLREYYVPLKEYFVSLMDNQNKAVDAAFLAQQKAIDAALDAQQKAIDAALVAQQKAVDAALTSATRATDTAADDAKQWRLNANEWRGAMDDREKNLVGVELFKETIIGVRKELETLRQDQREAFRFINRSEGSESGRTSNRENVRNNREDVRVWILAALTLVTTLAAVIGVIVGTR